MRGFMKKRSGIRGGIDESAEGRHVDAVFGNPVMSVIGTEHNRDFQRLKERINLNNSIRLRQFGAHRRFVSIDLSAIENRECARKHPGAAAAIILDVAVMRNVCRGFDFFPQDHCCCPLALADLGAGGLELTIGSPHPVAVSGFGGGNPKRE